jgi:hypothetical protein
MPDSMIIANKIELMSPDNPQGTQSMDPRCLGAAFILDRNYSLGAPQPVASIIESLAVDGERPIGRRASNRTLVMPISIVAPDRATLVSAREVLLGTVDQQSFTITWVRDSASPVIIDCFRAQPSDLQYDIIAEQGGLVCQLTLTIPALPYLRSSDPQPIAFSGTQAGRSAAPPPTVLLDDYTTVSGANWSAVTAGTPTGSAAHWTNPGPGNNAVYTSTFAAKNIRGMTSLTHWIGTASVPVPVPVSAPYTPVTPYPISRDLGELHVHYTLTDSAARTIQIGQAWRQPPGAKLTFPTWTLVTTRLPQTGIGSFDYGHVVSIRATVTNYAYAKTNVIDVFLDDLRAAPSSVARTPLGSRSISYTMAGILGTARAPINMVAAQSYTPIGVGPVSPASYSDGFLTLPCNSSFSAVAQSGSILNLNGSSVFASIAQIPSGNGTTQGIFQARFDASNLVAFVAGGDSFLTCQLRQLGVNTVNFKTAFLGTQYPYWRIREGAPTGTTGVVQLGWVNFTGTVGNIGPRLPGAPGGLPQGPFNSGTTDGDIILVHVLTMGAGTVTVTDSNSNTYTQVNTVNTGDGQTQYWFKAPSAVGVSPTTDNITISCTASQGFSVSAYGAAGFFDVDVTATNFAATANKVPTVVVPAMGVSGEMEIVTFMSGFHPVSDTSSTPSGWSSSTPNPSTANNSASLYSHTYWKKATAQTADTCTSAYVNNENWSAIALALKPRLNSGTIYWDVSIDGVSWTNILSNAHSLGTKLQFMRAYFSSGYTGTEPNPSPFLVSGVGVI